MIQNAFKNDKKKHKTTTSQAIKSDSYVNRDDVQYSDIEIVNQVLIYLLHKNDYLSNN